METSFAYCDEYVWRKIAQYLHFTDRACLRMTCKYFAQIIARTKLTWNNAHELICGYVARNMSPIEMLTYRDHISGKTIALIDSRENAEYNKNITYLRANIAHILGDLAVTIPWDMCDQLYALSCRSELELDTMERMRLLQKARNGALKIRRNPYSSNTMLQIDLAQYPLAIVCANSLEGEKLEYWNPLNYSSFRIELFREYEFAKNTSGMWDTLGSANSLDCANISHSDLMTLSRAIIGPDNQILDRAHEFARKVSNCERYDDLPRHSSPQTSASPLDIPICSRDRQIEIKGDIAFSAAQLRRIAQVSDRRIKRAIIIAFALGKLLTLRARMYHEPELVSAFRELWQSCPERYRTSAISKCYCVPWNTWIRLL